MRTILTALLFACVSSSVFAQNVIRDAEIESDIRVIANPIFNAAGLNASQVRINIINDDDINAFVAGGQNLFLYSGLILETKNVGQLAGVIAHESGHMAGGHLIRIRNIMERASTESILATIAGIAVGVGSGDAQAGIGSALGAREMSNRILLRHSRAFESAADQAGMATLDRLGYSTKDMADFLEVLSTQEVLPEVQRSPYLLTHPLSRERMEAVEAYTAKSRHKDAKWPSEWENKFRRIQIKILAFTQPANAERQYATQNNMDAYYATAIAAYRQGRIKEALDKIDVIEKSEPNNAFLYDLRGQILFEQGRIAESITAYKKAVALQPKIGLLHLSLAQSMLQYETGPTDGAVDELLKARAMGERDTPLVYRWLAVAYGRAGKEGQAKLALAEEALLKRDTDFAIQQAKRAEELLKGDSAGQQRARDIRETAQRIKKQKEDNN